MGQDPMLTINLFANGKIFEEANSQIDDMSKLLFDKAEINSQKK
jgi:hypothetical protein